MKKILYTLCPVLLFLFGIPAPAFAMGIEQNPFAKYDPFLQNDPLKKPSRLDVTKGSPVIGIVILIGLIAAIAITAYFTYRPDGKDKDK